MRSLNTRRAGKKYFFLFMPVMLALALFAASCGSDDDDDDAAVVATNTTVVAEESISVGIVYDIGGRGDQSFNDAAYAGLSRAGTDLGVDANDVSPNADGSNREELLELQAQNRDLVIGIGFLFGQSIEQVAIANPGVSFAIIDGGPTETSPDNLAHLLFAEEEGSYLVGLAAGLKTSTDKVGFIGGVDTDLIKKFEAGFRAGVAAANEDIEIFSDYITRFPDFSGFNDPAGAKVIAEKMFEDGADIVYHAAGGSGNGLFEAAKERSDSSDSKVWAIGVDSDQYNLVDDELKEYILTSMIKRVDVAVYNIINDRNSGDFQGGMTPVVYDLSVDGVGYSTSGGFVDDIVDELEAAKADIISGEIQVPTTP